VSTMRVPFVDLLAQYRAHQAEFDAAFRAVIERTAFIGGEFVQRFEAEFARACGVAHCVAVANGTDAIYIALRMLGIGPGDEVITTAASWIATSETVTQAGARVVFVDVDEYYNIDCAQVEARIGPRTKAIIPVHLYGQAAQVDLLAQLAKKRGLHVIEDCAQAHLAERNGIGVGRHGVLATFSFYPGKNLGAYGDAGAIVTDDEALAKRCRMFANHGSLTKHQHEMEGLNSRLDGLQAALLSAKLAHLPAWTEARRALAARYTKLLAEIPQVQTPLTRSGSTHVYHLYVIQCERRDELKSWLASRGIETGVHYPTALPLLPAYRYLGMSAADVPRAARNTSRILSLPIYPEMTAAMQDHVVASIAAFYDRGS
jgi:dTDP-4-amino-4,6-dideoxygalactose transaminase